MFCRLAGLNLPPLRCMSAATSATMGGTHKPLNTLFNNMPTTIFEVMSKLATQHNSVNLGQGVMYYYRDTVSSCSAFGCVHHHEHEHRQITVHHHASPGFPDDALEGPASMKDIVGRYVQENSNQYPSLMGLPSLRQALARHNKVCRTASYSLHYHTPYIIIHHPLHTIHHYTLYISTHHTLSYTTHQYTPYTILYSQRYYDLDVDWQSEVVITVGATEALTAALMGLLNEGDEVCRVWGL